MNREISRDLVKGFRIALGFSVTLVALAFAGVYAAATWGALPNATTGTALSSSAWNDIVSQVNGLTTYVNPTPIVYQGMLPNGTATVKYADGTNLVFNRMSVNLGGAYDATTGIFTAPVKGRYEFCVSLHSWNDVGTAGGISLNPAGVPGAWVVRVMNYHGSSTWEDNYKCRIQSLSAGAQMRYYVYGSNGLNVSTSDYTYVSGRLLNLEP